MKYERRNDDEKKDFIFPDIIDNMQHRLALITVVYQNYNVLEDLFSSIKKQNKGDYQLIMADLSDNRKVIKTDIPITVIETKNLGYAHGINICLNEAIKQGYTQFAIINCDVILDKTFIENILRSLSDHSSAIIGGKIYYAKGYEFHKNRYKNNQFGHVLWYAGGKVDWKNAFISHRGVDDTDHGQYDTFKRTDFVPGTLMAFDKSVVDKVGLWNEKYFLYFEDADFCERAKRKGMNLYYDPSIIMWHKNAQSTGGAGSKLHQKYQQINRVRFGLKYAPLKTKLFLMKNYLLNK